MVADEKAVIVSDVRIHDLAHRIVVEVLDGVVPQETPARNHPETDVGAPEGLHHPGAIEAQRGIQNHREAEPRALPVLALDDEPLVALEEPHEELRVPAARLEQLIELL